MIFSHVLGSAESITATQQTLRHNFQRSDATHVAVDSNKTSLTGTGGRVEMGKNGGGDWRYNGGVIWRSPELELNDVGFLRQTDEMIQFTEARYLWQVPTDIYRNMNLRLEQSTSYDFGGNLNRFRYELQGDISWINNWSTSGGFGSSSKIHRNAFLRGGPRWRAADDIFYYASINSDRSKKFSFRVSYLKVKSEEDVFNRNRYTFRINYQPFDSFSMSLDNSLSKTQDRTQYVTTADFGNLKRYILGNIKNDTWSSTLRLNYSLNPNFSVQFYGQPYISRGRYSNFNYVNNSVASSIDDRVNFYTENQISKTTTNSGSSIYTIDENLDNDTYSFSNPDFSFVQLQTNLVVRWEYIPGSELFLVWARGSAGSQNINDSLTDSVSNQIFDVPANDTFLLKATYRFVR